MERITTRKRLAELARELGLRADWHEPDEAGITVVVRGTSFDNAGFWPHDDRTSWDSVEMYAIIRRVPEYPESGTEDIACVNLATLFAWACGTAE